MIASLSFGAIVKTAFATEWHVNCVGHGFEAGASPTDGSFFARVNPGCGSTYRWCKIYESGVWQGTQVVADSVSVCSAWSRDFGFFNECASSAKVYDAGVFTEHDHPSDC